MLGVNTNFESSRSIGPRRDIDYVGIPSSLVVRSLFFDYDRGVASHGTGATAGSYATGDLQDAIAFDPHGFPHTGTGTIAEGDVATGCVRVDLQQGTLNAESK